MGKIEETFVVDTGAGQSADISISVNHGFIKNTLNLTYGSKELVDTKIGFRYSGGEAFTIQGRKLHLKWIWNEWTGQPKSIVVVDEANDEILWWHKSQSASKVDIFATMPKWAWVFIVACIAIPIVAVGGAIPVVIGMLGAFTCRSIAVNDERSTAMNAGLCLGVTVIAWAVFVGFGIAVTNLI